MSWTKRAAKKTLSTAKNFVAFFVQLWNTKMNEDELYHKAIGCAIEMHKVLGPGLLESAYVNCLAHELSQHGLFVERELPMPVTYKTPKLDHGYRLDIL